MATVYTVMLRTFCVYLTFANFLSAHSIKEKIAKLKCIDSWEYLIVVVAVTNKHTLDAEPERAVSTVVE